MSETDDDPTRDFVDDLPTIETQLPPIADEDVFPGQATAGEELPDTGPHRSTDYLAGREAGFGEGINAACAVLAGELRRAGLAEADIPKVALRVRQGAEELG
jgi:hypothetical protein